MPKNKLLVPEAESFMDNYKEEFAHEFGIHFSAQEMDAKAKDMTRSVLGKTESNCQKDE